MPTPIPAEVFQQKHYIKATTSTAQGTNVARDDDRKVSSGNRKIDVDQNGEESKRQRKVRETIPKRSLFDPNLVATSSAISSSSDNHKVSADRKVVKKNKKAKLICTTPGCGKQVQARGHCREHDPHGKATCKHTGCKNYVYKGKYCKTHDPNTSKCAKVGCNSIAQGGKYCYTHEPSRQKCKVPDCTNKVNAKFLCKKHDPTYRNCKEANCNNQVYARGRCKKHDHQMYGQKKED